MTSIRNSSTMSEVASQQMSIHHEELKNSNHPPIPLMSIIIPPIKYPRTLSSSCRTSISEPTCLSPTPPISISDDNISLTSTLVDYVDISKFHFAHVIKVPHGTDLLASDNQSTTVCINSNGNIIHLITPTGYHIRSSRWPESEKKIINIFWCEILQVYIAATSASLYTLNYDSNQSLSVEKCLDFSHHCSSSKVFIAWNSYRFYIHDQSTNSIDVYTLQFAHLHRKQLPDCLVNNQIEAFSSTSSFLVFSYKQITNKLIVLDPTTMSIEYELDLPYEKISSMQCFDDKNILVLIGTREDGENRLVFLNFGNENEASEMQQQMIVEKAIELDEQFVYILPNCRDLMVLNMIAARVQYVKYRV